MAFKIRGPITSEDIAPYIIRPADTELKELVTKLDYIALIGPHLSGKTSALMRVWEALQTMPRFVTGYLNLSTYAQLSEERWYEKFYKQLQRAGLPEAVVTDAIDFREALLDALQGELANRAIIILLDEVESVPLEFRTSFFATLREMFVSRGVEQAFRRVSFTLAGSYIPDELIPDASISPFRVAQKVYIDDATDLTPFFELLDRPKRPIASDVPQRITDWTEGDVYLTQSLCERLEYRYAHGQITPAAVDQVVERYLYDDDSFASLEKKITAHPRLAEILRKIVLDAAEIPFVGTDKDVMRGWLLGCIKPDARGMCTTRNLIYEHVLRQLLNRLPSVQQAPVPEQPKRKPLRDRYLLDEIIRRGQINNLYRARDLQTDEMVAVKQLMPVRGGDVIAWRRFQREGEALKQLDHENIVTLIDTFRVQDYNYIVMEYVGGGTVDQLLSRQGRQEYGLIIDVLLGVADALRYAHGLQMVHRDIKPSNILLTPRLAPRLADFGLARFMQDPERITATHMVVGTPAYMSPEGYDNTTLTPAEDIWSLGITLYEMLTGMLPFSGRTHDHLRHAIQNDPIPDVRSIRPDTPHELVDLLYAMLERDPQARLQDGAMVYEALIAAKATARV